jgi:RNA polymerase sigma-70 factor (ECF subfamily)
METTNKKPNSSVMLDNDIIDLYWKRDERAITETDNKYHRYLYSIARNILLNKQDCEESLNDTYFVTWNKIPPSKPNAFQNFLSKITRDISIDKYRKNNAEKRIPSELTTSLDELDDCLSFEVSAEESFIVNQISLILNSYLRSLSQKEAFIFVSRYYYADSIENIAKMLKISESTVFRNLAKMRKGLRERIESVGYTL